MNEKVNVAIFILALALLFVFAVALPPDPEASVYENRSMAGLPVLTKDSFFSGSYFSELEVYLSDATAYRTSILQLSAGLEDGYGIRMPGGAIPVDLSGGDLGIGLIPEVDDEELYLSLPDPADSRVPETETGTAAVITPLPSGTVISPSPDPDSGGSIQAPGTDSDPATRPSTSDEPDPGQPPEDRPGQAPASPASSASPSHSPASPATPSPAPPVQVPRKRVDPEGPFSIDLNYSENVIMYERYRENTRAARRYAEILNSYMGKIPEGVRVFSMLAPIRVEFMSGYAATNDSQLDTIGKIYDILDGNIIRTPTYDMLAAHSDEYIYFRTDHHWTALGAYYAYLSFTEAAGFAPVEINNYIEHSIPGFLGSFAKGTQNRNVREHPDTLYYYELDSVVSFSRKLFVIPEDLSKLSYRVFMGGDYAKLDYTSSNKNGRTLVIIKDSYANALIPWLSPHYERVIVIDPRQYSGSVTKLLGELEQADLLFMNYVAATAMSDFIEMIYSVR